MKQQNQHFTAIVIGENHKELIKKYGSFEVEPYITAEYNKADEYKKQRLIALNIAKQYKEKEEIGKDEVFSLDYDKEIERIKKLDPTDFYLEIGDEHDDWYMDEETGNYLSKLNPNKKYDAANVGKSLSMPLILKDGSESFSEKKCNIDWGKTHLNEKEVYEDTWDMIMCGKTPETELQKQIYENMQGRYEYFKYFGTKENYVASSTAFWGYAYVDENGWKDFDDSELDQTKWIIKFYDNFIKPLPEDVIITVYACFRK